MPRRVLITLLVALAFVAGAMSVAFATHEDPRPPTAVGDDGSRGAGQKRKVVTTSTTVPLAPLLAARRTSPVVLSGGPGTVVSRVPTTDRVIFLGIDDGLWRDDDARDILVRERVPITMFLVREPLVDGQTYFRELVAAGATVEAHTIDHPDLSKLSSADQRKQICGTRETITKLYGRAPTLFRPPYGKWNSATRAAAASCGFRAVVMWMGATNNGRLDIVGGQLHPGDILLMHFRHDLAQNLELVFAEVRAQGFTIARLEDYVGGDPIPTTPRSAATATAAKRA